MHKDQSINKLSIGEASIYIGISIDTLRRWEKKGRINPYRSPGGHRYYSKNELDGLFGKRYSRDTTKPYPRKLQDSTDSISILTSEQNIIIDNNIQHNTSSDYKYEENNSVDNSNIPSQPIASVLLPHEKPPLQTQLETIINETSSIENTKTSNSPTESLSMNNFSANKPSTPEHLEPLQNKKEVQEEPSLAISQKPLNTEEVLKNLNINYTQKQNSKTQIILIITIIIITILDVTLFILWYSSSTNLVVPIP
jgi:excisionase family DNA binding protein